MYECWSYQAGALVDSVKGDNLNIELFFFLKREK